MRVYRLASERYAPNSSEGARLYGGRWNRSGTPVIYTSTTASLAALEVIAHYGMIPADYRVIDIVIPENVEIGTVDIQFFGPDWYAEASIPRTSARGTLWAKSLKTAVLRVPSAVIRSEQNYLLNPLHPRFRDILFEVRSAGDIDGRLRLK